MFDSNFLTQLGFAIKKSQLKILKQNYLREENTTSKAIG
jgi:hypothetical protein